MRWTAVPFGALLLAFLALSGCASTRGPAVPEGDPTEYAVLRDKHNERVAGLDRLWARAVVAMRFIDEDGKNRREQGEGHFQYRRDSDLAVTIGKLGETYFHAGSNADRYWWIDLSGDEKAAWVGLRSLAGDRSTERWGVPIQPTHVVDLGALREWPETIGGQTSWSTTEAGRVRFAFERDGRTVVVHADSFSGEAVRIELLDGDGEPIAWSLLGEYAAAPVRGGGRLPSRIPTKLTLVSPGTESEIDIWLNDPQIDPAKPKDIVFDIAKLIEIYRVDRVVDVDAER